ncbi:hypothetical protein SAMN05443634_10716 [Chishuiella changwenlii]|jgi:hypothetical protein|uniref:Uncharacterized protein n=1 Tax=Chishuiella changwenlii TaxID=1434701 RepID=A0A1M6YSB3_9FLAO|nr:hypothetical protein [Chishuiella changwenlii]GGE88387.1 hypothetical protein GCM10010984_02660 [Chishuiella changwenlii]SHL21107.1 hypothetical protein SAMN05443634_10716 [Chishuiella changwenlii]
MKRLFIIASFALMIISCKNDKLEIDSSSAQTFSETVDEISKGLPLLQQDKFKEALQIVFEYKTSQSMDNESRWLTVRTLLNGKTVDEVFDIAEQVALENKFTWNRNQVPLVNGIPKPNAVPTEEVVTEPTSNVQRFDFSLKQDDEGINISPFFYNAQGEEIQLTEPVTATIEVFNSGSIVYSFRSKIDPNSMDDLYRKNAIAIKYALLDASKIKTDRLDILIRVPNSERYLTNRKAVQIPMNLIGAVSTSDSLAVASSPAQVSKEAEMLKSLSNRFINNLTKKNYSGAFALTRSNEWSTFQKFSSMDEVKNLDQATISDAKVLDADEKVALVQVNANLKDESAKSYQLTLEKINNKWFIVNFK